MPGHSQEPWFVTWARVLSWMLGGFYCFMFIGGCGLVREEVLALHEQGALQERNDVIRYFSYCAVIATIQFFFFGFPALMLAGFVRYQTQQRKFAKIPPSK